MSEQAARNTDPPAVRCDWVNCGQRLRWEDGGYWLRCRTGNHGARHDPRVRGAWWRLRIWLGQ